MTTPCTATDNLNTFYYLDDLNADMLTLMGNDMIAFSFWFKVDAPSAGRHNIYRLSQDPLEANDCYAFLSLDFDGSTNYL